MGLDFEWDANKARANLKKHGVSFEEASTAFGDPYSSTIPDPLYAREEERLIIIGLSYRLRTLIVVHAEEAGKIRIISAREATRHERRVYEEGS